MGTLLTTLQTPKASALTAVSRKYGFEVRGFSTPNPKPQTLNSKLKTQNPGVGLERLSAGMTREGATALFFGRTLNPKPYNKPYKP